MTQPPSISTQPSVPGLQRRLLLRSGLACTAAGAMLASGCSTTAPTAVQRRMVRSSASDGVNLAVFETGNPKGRPVIFIHGFAQSHDSWVKQMEAPELQRGLRLISFDLRGHGDSDKPLVKEAYHDPERWGRDLQSVIRATGAERPSLVAWSYGGRVLNDYLSVFGDGEVGSLNYVAATSTAERFGLGRSYALIVPMLSDDAAVAERATGVFLQACFEKQPTATEMEAMQRFNAKTPVAVRKLLAGRPAPYEETLRRIKVPVLLTHGDQDQISAVAMSEYTRRMVPAAQLSIYPGIGHSSFFEDPQRFNGELMALVRSSR